MWLQGLWKGLGRELGARRMPEHLERGRGRKVRVREPELVAAYAELYKPREMFLVSKHPVPASVKAELRERGVMVVDDVGFESGKLAPIIHHLLQYAQPSCDILVLKGDLVKLIAEKSRKLGLPPEKLVEEAVRKIP